MLKHSPRCLHPGIVVGLLLSLILAGGPVRGAAPVTVAAPVPYVLDIHRPAAVSPQLGPRLAFGAAVQTVRNLVGSTALRSASAQSLYARYQRTQAGGKSVAAQLGGWEDALDRFVPAGRYSVVRRSTAGAALRLAALHLRKSAHPVGLVVAATARPLVMVGFTATADPAAGAFRLLSVSLVDPGYPAWPVLTPGPDAPVQVLGLAPTQTLLAPGGGALSVIVPAIPRSVRQIALGLSQHPDNSLAALDAVTARHGHAPAIWSLWSAWGDGSTGFPSTLLLDSIVERGSVPILFWSPVGKGQIFQDRSFSYARIVAGDHDDYIRTWARAAKAWNKRILLRFAQEMNGRWFPWGIGNLGNTAKNFVAAWQHIHTIVRKQVGAKNVRFVWSPYSNAGCASCPAYAAIYPGDAYVDYAGFSVFDWGGNVPAVKAFRAPVEAIHKLTKKPIIVAETGTPAGSRKASWLLDGFREVWAAYPRIVAIVYFDVLVTKQPDWRLGNPQVAEQAYARLLKDPRFQGRIP